MHNVRIIWNNELEESGKPFDILLKINKNQYFIEVKASITSEKRFILSGNEFNFVVIVCHPILQIRKLFFNLVRYSCASWLYCRKRSII